MGFPAYLDIILGVCICVGFVAAGSMILAALILLRMIRAEDKDNTSDRHSDRH